MPNPMRFAPKVLRRPDVALAATTAGLAVLAWALGTWASGAWAVIGMWPLGTTLLGWLATAPQRACGHEAPHAAGSIERREINRLRWIAAGAAMVAVGAAEAAWRGPGAAATVVAAGVLLPATVCGLLDRLAEGSPARGVGSAELRLLGTAIACAPLATLVRHLGPWGLPAVVDAQQLVDALFGDLLAATVFTPMAAALAHSAALRFEGLRGPPATDPNAPPPSPRPTSPSEIPWRLFGSIAAAIGVCVIGAWGLRATGHGEIARIAAVTHLVLGLLVARTVSGTPGALLLALNAVGMAIAFTAHPALSTGRYDDPTGMAVPLLLLAGVFALQSLLHSVSTDSREAARALIRQALRSDLSGLPNQRALGRIVGAMLASPRRARFWLVGVVLPDIARWSDLTDSAAAAELERSVAGRLRSSFEPLGARVAHPSSGRFVITLGDRADGLRIRQMLRATLGGQRFDTSEQSIQLRYHAGMVEVPAGSKVGPDAVLTALSMALQRAANDPAGIHRATASAELVDDYRTELRTIETVSRALTEGRVRLFAERIEPVSPYAGGKLHFEVLARVTGDDGRLLQPKQFLPAIWHAGLHSKLDRLVFVRTVAFLAAHRSLHDAVQLCSINVCGPTLCDPEFLEYVQRCLSTHAVEPRRLMIEITESAAIADLEVARAHVARLSEMGLVIALDDFGTGLATFDYLKRLKADVLKIDGSFIRQIVDNPLDREIVGTIVRMARATGARTIAEWIETPEQRAVAVELGVDLLQGRLIASPVPLESLRKTAPPATSEHTPGNAARPRYDPDRHAGTLELEPVRYEHGLYGGAAATAGAPRRKPAPAAGAVAKTGAGRPAAVRSA
jgi:EAL domain-containing protein (putative c-di-GMP-specific phosphodiesterase class I)/GGDEF domain-containing protein